MKYDFDFSNMPDYVLIKTGQFAVVEDFYKLLKDLQASPKWVKGAPLIIDHKYLDLKKMTFADVKMILSIFNFNDKKLQSKKCAFVIQSDSKTLCDELSKLADPETLCNIRFFTSLAPAKVWVSN